MTQPSPRLFVDAALAAGSDVELSRDQAHYLAHVMRMTEGDQVSLFNGRDGEWSAVIRGMTKNGGAAGVETQSRPQEKEDGPWLVFAPIKKAGTDFLVEKATELGASRLRPVFTRHTNATRVNVARLGAHCIEAAELSERLTVPAVDAPQPLDRLTASWPAERRLLVLDESGGGAPIADVLNDLGAAAADGGNPACAFLSGPEGGFAPNELEGLRRLDFVTTVGLGPRILRADTAALAALACWQALVGGGSNPGSGT